MSIHTPITADPSLLPVRYPTFADAQRMFDDHESAFDAYVKSQAARIANETVQANVPDLKAAELVGSLISLSDVRALGLKHRRLDHAMKLVREGKLRERLRDEVDGVMS